MKFSPSNNRKALANVRLALALAAAMLAPLFLYGSAPTWWSQRGVLVENAVADDYTPANQGQLKNIAKAAVAEMDARLPGGAGDPLHNLISSWSTPASQTNDFAPVNAGQLKTVAKPFCDRLIAVKYVDGYPWIASGAVPDDFGLVNIGQVKALFNFDLLAIDAVHDADANGLPDWWEKYYFGSVGVDPNAAAPRGDGLTNLEAFQRTLDPINTGEILAITPERIDENVPTGQTVTRTIRVTNRTSVARQLSFTPHSAVAAVHYAYTDSDQNGGPTFIWNDISGTGVHLDSVSDADNGFESFPLSFSFPYHGSGYTTGYVASDGFLTFGSGSDNWYGAAMPDSRSPAAMIAAFEDDLDLGASGDVFYQDYGDRVVIQFENAVRYYGDGYVTFQIVLQRDGTIMFYYKDMEGTVDEAVVGIQNLATNQGLTIARYQPYLKSNFAVRVTPPSGWQSAPWLQVAPATMSLAPGGSAELSVTLDGRTLAPGLFAGGVTISTDEPSITPGEMPVAMTVVDENQLDNDNDGLTNGQERALGTDPNKIDTDGDGMSDGWEVAHNLNPLSNDAAVDPDGDGLTNLQEYRQRTDPFDYFNGATPVIDIISGNNQFGEPGTFAARMLTVRVRNSGGQPYKNALVLFTAPYGSGQLASAMNPDALQGIQMSVRTNADGLASAAFLFSNISGQSSRITAGTGAFDRFFTTDFRVVTIYHPPPSPTPIPGSSPSPTASPTATPAPPYRYAIIDLGKDLYPRRVNNKGWVLMNLYNPVRWKGGVAETLICPNPSQDCLSQDMNDDGTVVGWGGYSDTNPYSQNWNDNGINDLQRGLVWPANNSAPNIVSGPATPSWVPTQHGSIQQAYLSAISNPISLTDQADLYGGAYTGDSAYTDRRFGLLHYQDILNAQRWSGTSGAPTALSFSNSIPIWQGLLWFFNWQGALDSVSRANSSRHYIGQRINAGPTVGITNVSSKAGMIDGQQVDFDPVDINEAGVVVGARGTTMVIRTPGVPDQTTGSAGGVYPVAINDHVRPAVPQPFATPDPSATPIPVPQILSWDGNVTVLWERQANQTWYPFGLEEMIPSMDGWYLDNITDMNDSGVIVGDGSFKDPANPQAQWEDHGFMLVPLEIELSPKLTDDEGHEISGSEKPKPSAQSNEMVERDPATNQNDAAVIRIAWRELKIRIGSAFKGKKVTWSMESLSSPSFRGRWDHAVGSHADRFEASTAFGAYSYRRLSQEQGETTIDADGFTAIRANVPPIGLNKARIKIEFEGSGGPVGLIDLEVPGVIVIDPGHGIGAAGGSREIGATGATTQAEEHAIALDIARRMAADLRKLRDTEHLQLKVFLTRTGTANVSFQNRTRVARENGCDVYVSIHFNGVEEVPLRRHPFGMWDTNNNINFAEDQSLAIRLRQKVQTAIAAVESEASRNAPTDGVTSEQHEANNQKRLDTLSDSQSADPTFPDYNGNIAGYTPCRAALIELEWISNANADILFNEGNRNLSVTANRMREEAAQALADASIEDLRAQPVQ